MNQICVFISFHTMTRKDKNDDNGYAHMHGKKGIARKKITKDNFFDPTLIQ